MKLLITPPEVADTSFSQADQIDTGIINDSHIRAAELKFLAPVLKEYYPLLEGEQYRVFREKYIKPALAYYVKYMVILSLFIKSGKTGMSSNLSVEHIGYLKKESREIGDLLLDVALDYMEKHPEEFPSFDREKATACVTINGGFVL